MLFLIKNIFISIDISLKFLPKGPINNNPALPPGRRQAIIWTNGEYYYWRKYAPLGPNE